MLKLSLKIIVIIILILYISFGIFLLLNQKKFLYHPTNQEFDTCISFSDYQKINYNNTRFYFKQKSKDSVIVYYHGNAGSTCDRSFSKSIFEQSEHSILFVEYAGYSNDNREPSKELIQQDVRNVHEFIQQNLFKKVIVYGQSIGASVASYHAFLGNVDYLILATPFSSLTDVAKSQFGIYPINILLKEKYNNIELLKNFKNKILIIHGDNDSVIPHKFSEKLYHNLITSKRNYMLIEGVGHNDIWSSNIFKEKIIEAIQKE